MAEAAIDNLRTDVKLPVRTKLGWGLGGFVEAMMASGMPALLNPIFNIALKIDPAKLGLVGSVPRFFDAIYDMWLGNLSDNARTRWGRRRPFIVIGVTLCAIFFMAIWWMPIGWSSNSKLGFFAIMSTGYWLSYGTFAIPWNALGFELSTDFNERTSVQSYQYFMIQIGALAVAALYPLCFWHFFQIGSSPGVRPEVFGARGVTMLFGVILLIAGLMPAILTKEHSPAEHRPKMPLLRTLKLTFTDRLFLHFIVMIVVSIFGVGIAGSVGLYVTIYHVAGGNAHRGADISFVCSMVSIGYALSITFLIPKISKRIGKKYMILVGEFFLGIGGLSTWFFYTPKHPYWIMFSAVIGITGMACFQVLYGSFLGDICDVDELRCGTRREGVYQASATFLNKIIYASQGAINGIILDATGFNAKLPIQTHASIFHMRLVYAIMPAIFAIIGATLAITFPITARRAAETQRLLVIRRAELNAAEDDIIST